MSVEPREGTPNSPPEEKVALKELDLRSLKVNLTQCLRSRCDSEDEEGASCCPSGWFVAGGVAAA